MDNKVTGKLLKIGEAFNIEGPLFSYEELSMGNINRTYKVNYIRDDGTGLAKLKPFLFQKVNTYAFKHPVELMENIDRVTEYIREKRPGSVNLHFHHTGSGDDRKTYLFDGDEFWRVSNFVPSVTFMTCDDLNIIRNAGKAFGDFQTVLKDFDPAQLFYTIPDFHDTRKRYEKLERDIKADPCGRVAGVKDEIDYILSVKDKACLLTDLSSDGKLPLRVTHNDTKINNVLFDEETHEALVVIDLDTVMPGIVGSDFGDAIRFAANYTEEDSRDTSKTGIDLNVFWAFAEGFLSETADALTDLEIDTLAASCFSLTCELVTRFLDDYIDGDKYFKINYPDHNLVRTRCQIALARDMERKMEAMDAIVKGCVAKYRSCE